MFVGADKLSACVPVCAHIYICPPACMHVLTSKEERMMAGKSAAVVERTPTGTRHLSSGSESVVN